METYALNEGQHEPKECAVAVDIESILEAAFFKSLYEHVKIIHRSFHRRSFK